MQLGTYDDLEPIGVQPLEDLVSSTKLSLPKTNHVEVSQVCQTATVL